MEPGTGHHDYRDSGGGDQFMTTSIRAPPPSPTN